MIFRTRVVSVSFRGQNRPPTSMAEAPFEAYFDHIADCGSLIYHESLKKHSWAPYSFICTFLWGFKTDVRVKTAQIFLSVWEFRYFEKGVFYPLFLSVQMGRFSKSTERHNLSCIFGFLHMMAVLNSQRQVKLGEYGV